MSARPGREQSRVDGHDVSNRSGFTYGSVCSGIEAASVAWEPLGWKAAWFSEIEAFPKAVLAHRYPDIPNLGDMTKLERNRIFRESKIDLLVGGTPCQSLSLAGKRGGLEDARGHLALVYCQLAERTRPRWIVWENVPGVLSSGKGRDFGTILGALADCGYGFAYRVLDARFFGVPQQRRRVFVVGHLGDWRPAAQVLFEQGSGAGDAEPGEAVPREDEEDGLQLAVADAGIAADDGKRRGMTANSGDISRCLSAGGIKRLNPTAETFITDPEMRTRYLTPLEYERLQGFPDYWTQVPFNGKPAEKCADTNQPLHGAGEFDGGSRDGLHRAAHPVRGQNLPPCRSCELERVVRCSATGPRSPSCSPPFPVIAASGFRLVQHYPLRNPRRARGNDCVSEGLKLVWPKGYPISHATHRGFRFPPTIAANEGVCRDISDGALPEVLTSCAIGVGNILLPTTVSKFGNRLRFQAEAAVIVAAIALHARGVGNIRSAHCSLLRHARLLFDPLSSPVVVGVGDNKHPVSEVGSAEGASRKYEPGELRSLHFPDRSISARNPFRT